MARTATGYPVALGFRGQLATGQRRRSAGRLDLKRGAIIPLVNLVRFHALAGGVTISARSTGSRPAASVGALERGVADGLREAFEVINGIRFEHHAAQVQAGATPTTWSIPSELPPIARTELREALGRRAAGPEAGRRVVAAVIPIQPSPAKTA